MPGSRRRSRSEKDWGNKHWRQGGEKESEKGRAGTSNDSEKAQGSGREKVNLASEMERELKLSANSRAEEG